LILGGYFVGMDFIDLKNNLKKQLANPKVIRIALLGDTATQLLVQAVKGYGYEVGIEFQVFEAEYDQIERNVFDPGSELYRFKPQFVLIFQSSHKLLKTFASLDSAAAASLADRHIEAVQKIFEAISANLSSKILYANFMEIDDGIFGNYSNKTPFSFHHQIRKLNYRLMELSQRFQDVFINDVARLQGRHGQALLFDPKFYFNADIGFSLDFLPILAKNTADIIQAASGAFKKCLILDLDNTVWGGIIGDDGLEDIEIGELGAGRAYSEIQRWAKQLKKRGVILAVCSKGDEKIAKEAFLKHPDMVLRLDDIAVFVCNWNNKVDNIRYIQSVLNIGFDSMVFLDDTPFERNMVRQHLPAVTVPEMPTDVAECLDFLTGLNLFETASFTQEDELRTRQYQEEAVRSGAQKQFVNEADFLASLSMRSLVKPFDDFTIPRIAQLTQRSNQFNLRTIRCSEDDIRNISASPGHLSLCFTLEDKYGDNGLVSVVMLEKQTDGLFINNWIMSCRVLRRGMEQFVLNQVVELARTHGFPRLRGEYIETPKNALVKDHYANLGFRPQDGRWVLDVENYEPKPCHITPKN
jgi:FkbH-like protein